MDIHDRIADAFASVDELVADAAHAFRERLLTLLNEQSERNEVIWNDAGAPLNITVDMMARVPVRERQLSNEWMNTMSIILAAARRQAWLEVIANPLFAKAYKHSARVKDTAGQMSKSELKHAADEGVSHEAFNKAKRARMERTAAL